MDLMLDDRRTERLADDRPGIRLRDRPFSMDLQIRLQQAGLSRTLARLYAARGVEPEHIHYPVTSLTHYRSMKGIMTAANLLADAILADQHICISGDYDVDGCCATSILIDGLRQLGVDAAYVIPDRVTEGYGLTPPLVDRIPESTQMIITVDNGIAAHAGVRAAKDRGMKVIVTDHHLAGNPLAGGTLAGGTPLPDADAIVNPNQPGCGFPDKDTCGAGVAWYLLVATRAVLKKRGQITLSERLSIGGLLDLVAFATIADVVPLGYNNRILVNAGLNRIRAGKTRAGIRALAAVAGVSLDHVTAQDFGFLLGPRINAAGRLEDMRTGVRLLLTNDMDEAERLALELHQTNHRRRNIESDMRAEAEEMVGDSRVMDTGGLPNVLCLRGDTWHEGVVGLVAGRLKEKWHRPALAFAPGSDENILKGSARSVPGL
ncbi:single-stranded-DNA-specific exonuclease RecJ, partial [Acidithiobacillus sp.]